MEGQDVEHGTACDGLPAADEDDGSGDKKRTTKFFEMGTTLKEELNLCQAATQTRSRGAYFHRLRRFCFVRYRPYWPMLVGNGVAVVKQASNGTIPSRTEADPEEPLEPFSATSEHDNGPYWR